MSSLYDIFPKIRTSNTVTTQLLHTLDELAEVEVEVLDNNREKILLESIDVIHSTMTMLNKAGYSKKEIDYAVKQVIKKNAERGYYEI